MQSLAVQRNINGIEQLLPSFGATAEWHVLEDEKVRTGKRIPSFCGKTGYAT